MTKKIEKLINCDNGDKVIYYRSPAYCNDIETIIKYEIVDSEIEKTLNLSIWDDFSFSASTRKNEGNSLEFFFNDKDPLYFCFDKLLCVSDKITIYNDESNDYVNSTLKFIREGSLIKLEFTDYKNEKNLIPSYKRYRVFVKNICYDNRSQNDIIKEKLVRLFSDLRIALNEQYHQITMDEYTKKAKNLTLSKKM